MKEKAKEPSERRKKPYLKPEVRKVTLTPEEAVLGFCKNAAKNGPVTSTCPSPVYCYGLGS
jgi:hypothetical protein